jgi:hypothetical protein
MGLHNVIEAMRREFGGVPPVPSREYAAEPLKPSPPLAVPSVPSVPPGKIETKRNGKFAMLAMAGKASQKPVPNLAPAHALAMALAAEFGTTPRFCWQLLDDGDRLAIATGDDPGRAEAWRCAVRSAVERGDAATPPPVRVKARPAPAAQDLAPVRCADCQHATPTSHPALIDCAAQVHAPGNCGPFRWWGLDFHSCQLFEGASHDR